jgi:hypothetical protein
LEAGCGIVDRLVFKPGYSSTNPASKGVPVSKMIFHKASDSPTQGVGCQKCRDVSLDIDLIEPALFLSDNKGTPAVLRGMCVFVSKSDQWVRKMDLMLNGKSSVQWTDCMAPTTSMHSGNR